MSNTDKPAMPTRPPNTLEKFMPERLSEAIAEQSKLMDNLAQQLLLVELAIPGLYATALKLSSGSDKLVLTWEIQFAFICWVVALLLTIVSMFPRYKEVNRNSPKAIEDFFNDSAKRKFNFLTPAILFFFLGIGLIILDLL